MLSEKSTVYYGSELQIEVLSGSRHVLLHGCQADAACALTRWQHFSAGNDVFAAICKI